MAVVLRAQNGEVRYNVNEYVLDTIADIVNLPTTCATGSTALVIETAEVYIKNGEGIWVSLNKIKEAK
jgi:hypothetical protein